MLHRGLDTKCRLLKSKWHRNVTFVLFSYLREQKKKKHLRSTYSEEPSIKRICAFITDNPDLINTLWVWCLGDRKKKKKDILSPTFSSKCYTALLFFFPFHLKKYTRGLFNAFRHSIQTSASQSIDVTSKIIGIFQKPKQPKERERKAKSTREILDYLQDFIFLKKN